MTRNRFDDNTPFWGGSANALLNAHALEGIDSGCAPSKGTGDWDVDVASGTVRIGNTTASVSASTVTLTQPSNDADFDSGETRIDLVHINSSGTVSKTEGTPASDPTSPDIPSSEALVALVVIDHSDSTLADSVINDERNLFAFPNVEDLNAAGNEDDIVIVNASNGVKTVASVEDLTSAGAAGTTFVVASDGSISTRQRGWAGGIGVGSLSTTDGTSATAEVFYDRGEIRVPGESSATDSSRIYHSTLGFDASQSYTVRFLLSNITIDNSSQALWALSFNDAPDGLPSSANDELTASISGDGTVRARTSEGGTSNESSDTSQGNAFVAGLNYVELSWDGSTLTVEASDGSSTVTASSSTNYPSGEPLHLHIGAEDNNGSGATNIDFDVDGMDINPP